MQIYYINIDRRTDRRAFMEQQFSTLGLSATRVAAVTPAEIDPGLLERYCKPRPLEFTYMPTELAVALSHRKIWQAMIDAGDPRALILEDDACLSSALPDFLRAIDAAPDAHDIIRIETRLRATRLSPALERVGDRIALHRPYGFERGAAGYIVTLATARRLLAQDDAEFFAIPVDCVMFDPISPLFHELNIRQTVPALCGHGEHLANVKQVGIWYSDIREDRAFARRLMRPPTLAGRFRRWLEEYWQDLATFAEGPGLYWRHGVRYWIVPFLK